MSGNDNKDNGNFAFIQEQVIEKKRKRLRRKLESILMTIVLAILFGFIAAVTFVFAEPKLEKFFGKEEKTEDPVTFPTMSPSAEGNDITGAPATDIPKQGEDTDDPDDPKEITPTPTPVIVEQFIDATLDDYQTMYDEMRKLSYEAGKSIVEVTSTFTVTDWLFGTSAEQTVSSSGLIVGSNSTNYLILVSLDRVKDANNVRIKFSDTFYVNATIQDYETELNIALLTILIQDISATYRTGLKIADLGESNTVVAGSPVIAIGNPNGFMNSIEVGIVTSRGSYATITDNRMELFHTDMDFNKKSDGVIINLKGKVIGWITRTVKDDEIDGLSTVIGISKLNSLIHQMGNQKPRIYFGIMADDMTIDVKQEHNISNGIFISEVKVDSPAFEAGLKNGDIILAVNSMTIINTGNFYNAIASYKTGDQVVVKILRAIGANEKEMELTVTLANKVQ